MMKLLKVGSHIDRNVISKASEKQKHKANILNSQGIGVQIKWFAVLLYKRRHFVISECYVHSFIHAFIMHSVNPYKVSTTHRI